MWSSSLTTWLNNEFRFETMIDFNLLFAKSINPTDIGIIGIHSMYIKLNMAFINSRP